MGAYEHLDSGHDEGEKVPAWMNKFRLLNPKQLTIPVLQKLLKADLGEWLQKACDQKSVKKEKVNELLCYLGNADPT